MAETVSVTTKDGRDNIKDQSESTPSQVHNEDGEENSSKVGEKEKKKLPPVDIAAAQTVVGARSSSVSQTPRTPGSSRYDTFKDKEKKIGHRRVDHGGQVTYKKIGTSQIMSSIQLGIQQAVGSLASRPELDVLIQDFYVVETILFPSIGSQSTPAHQYSEFRFKVYAPIAFRHFRDLFHIAPDDYLISLCNERLRELSNPGASGSIFYLTNDDEFIIKTVQYKEAEFLQKLLPGYYMNLNQNPRTLLPKFFGLYTYQCNAKNIRLIVMNNLLPTTIKMHQRYDLKGSTYKRKANKYESQKSSPTFKDLDFMEQHPDGLLLEAETYRALVNTIERDCRVLASFKIMDYSLLVGVHNLDQAAREKAERIDRINGGEGGHVSDSGNGAGIGLNRSRSINRQRLVAHSTAMESIQADADPIDEEDHVPPGGIPARNTKGERLLLFLGIIDILQSYRLKKKLEHTMKSMIHDGDTISVHRPNFYAQRFQRFMSDKVFKRIPSPLRHSPSRRRGASVRNIPRPISQSEPEATVAGTSNGQDALNGHVQLKPTVGGALIEDSTNEALEAAATVLDTLIPSSDGDTPFTGPLVEEGAIGKAASSVPTILGGPAPSTPLNLPAVLQDRPRARHPPPVPPRSPRVGRTAQGGSFSGTRGSGRGLGVAAFTANVYHPNLGTSSGTAAGSTMSSTSEAPVTSSPKMQVRSSPSHVTTVSIQDDRTDVVSVSDVQLEPRPDSRSNLVVESSCHVIASHGRSHAWTPPLSVEGSTPTWTEGTPSFTESSSSGDLGCPYTPARSLNTTQESTENVSGQEAEMTHL